MLNRMPQACNSDWEALPLSQRHNTVVPARGTGCGATRMTVAWCVTGQVR
uniref:Uncharacterized protein n=1 Tax=Rhodopseudomonas palustris (strain DX-1) TaxID=652103 RepID=E6VF24_RHOPX